MCGGCELAWYRVRAGTRASSRIADEWTSRVKPSHVQSSPVDSRVRAGTRAWLHRASPTNGRPHGECTGQSCSQRSGVQRAATSQAGTQCHLYQVRPPSRRRTRQRSAGNGRPLRTRPNSPRRRAARRTRTRIRSAPTERVAHSRTRTCRVITRGERRAVSRGRTQAQHESCRPAASASRTSG
jgi:hypothetical protein